MVLSSVFIVHMKLSQCLLFPDHILFFLTVRMLFILDCSALENVLINSRIIILAVGPLTKSSLGEPVASQSASLAYLSFVSFRSESTIFHLTFLPGYLPIPQTQFIPRQNYCLFCKPIFIS